MRTFTNFFTRVSSGIILVTLLLISCNQTEHKKSDDTLVEGTVPEKKELRRFTLTNTLPFDSVQYIIFGKDTIQRIQWKNGSKDGECLLGWVISKSHFIYPDHSDTLYAIDTAFNCRKYEYWEKGKLFKKIDVCYFENNKIETVDTTYINGKDTLEKLYSWYDTGRLSSKSTVLNRNFIDSSCAWASSGKPLSLVFYNKKSQMIRGLSYDDDGNLTDERYEDLKTGEIIYRIKDGKKVK